MNFQFLKVLIIAGVVGVFVDAATGGYVAVFAALQAFWPVLADTGRRFWSGSRGSAGR